MFAMLAAPSAALSQWLTVGDGIEYQEFSAAGPNRLFVARMARSNANATIDTTIANNALSGSKEIMTSQAARADDALTWWGGSWGARNQVVVAINGGFYDPPTGVITGGMIQSGWYSHWFADSFSGFTWKTNRTPFIGECAVHQAAKVYARFMSSGNTQAIDGINRPPGANDLVIFTPQYNTRTPSGTRTEVLVEMTRPIITTSGANYSSGTIRAKATSTGSTWIPFDHIVLSAGGSDGTTLNNNAVIGAEVRIFQELVDKNEPDVQGNNACQTNTGVDWSNVFATINSNYHFLKNNVVRVPDTVAHPGYQGYVNLNPRTAICYNASYVFFVICDGRSAQSIGMSCETLGNWAKNTLGATDGVNLDGGGSSTMVVNGLVKNVPSDGSERAVCNGVLMVNLAPRAQSTQFTPGQSVSTSATANCRLGPGTHYGIITVLSPSAQGTVLDHALKGIYAKGFYWWKCSFGGTTGWVAESLLQGPASTPVITQHPSSRSVAPGGTTSFTVAANGSAPLSYQWQKNQADLSDGGHYSGATTPTLTISNADADDVANYRCVVTNSFGSAASYEASLTVAACATPVLINGTFEGGSTGGIAAGWIGYTRTEVPSTVACSIQTASPAEGLQYQQIQTSYVASGGAGIYQVVTGCTSGATYTVSGWIRTNSANGRATVKCAPNGGTSYGSAIDLTPAATTISSTWVSFSGTVIAAASSITLFLDSQTHVSGSTAKAAAFDGISVTGCGASGAPEIIGQPAAQNVCPGSTASFTISASGDPLLLYQWQKNNSDISDGGHYSGVTTTSLTVSGADGNDVGAYRCLVSNASGITTSGTANLTLKAATMITQQPQPQSTAAGGMATFTVVATGEAPLGYQWQKNNSDLSNGGHYSGVTTASLTVSSADNNDIANYRCVVTADCGVVNSNPVSLTVNGAAVPGDFDHDGDVDQADFAHMQNCLDPSSIVVLDPNCADANLDEDVVGHVDQTDVFVFLKCMSGPNVAGNPGCAN